MALAGTQSGGGGGSRQSSPPRHEFIWQFPFVNVFKAFDVSGSSATCQRVGDVSEELDRSIGKRVQRISGAVSANNFIQIPGPKARIRSLGLTGAYIDLHIRPTPGKFFVIHLDVVTADQTVVRLSLSNMFRETKAVSRVIHCPCNPPPKWSIVVVHVPSVLSLHSRAVPGVHSLKAIQICSNVLVRNVYTSDTLYIPPELPREMKFSMRPEEEDPSEWREKYGWVEIPQNQNSRSALSSVAASAKRRQTQTGGERGRPSGAAQQVGSSPQQLPSSSQRPASSQQKAQEVREGRGMEESPQGPALSLGAQEPAAPLSLPQAQTQTRDHEENVSPNIVTMAASLSLGKGDIGGDKEGDGQSRRIDNQFSFSADSPNPPPTFQLVGNPLGLDRGTSSAVQPSGREREGERKAQTGSVGSARRLRSSTSQRPRVSPLPPPRSISASKLTEHSSPKPLPATQTMASHLGSRSALEAVRVMGRSAVAASKCQPCFWLRQDALRDSEGLPPPLVSVCQNTVVVTECSFGTAGEGGEGSERGDAAGEASFSHQQWIVQRCFFGHESPVEVLTVSDDGRLVASAENGSRGPHVRLWYVAEFSGAGLTGGAATSWAGGGMLSSSSVPFLRCLAAFSLPQLLHVKRLAFDSTSRGLAAVGSDGQRRTQIQIWDVSRAVLVARQVSDFPISCLRWSPFEDLRLVSCGRENVRFWRIKSGHLSALAVSLEGLARNREFTELCFERPKHAKQVFVGSDLPVNSHVFVGSADGAVLQIGYGDQKVRQVFRLHDGFAIRNIGVSEKCCVTAAEDGHVRVWRLPLDFRSFFLHALHQSPAVAAEVSPDGRRVLCGTEDGNVGMLDLHSQKYSTVARHHRMEIRDAAVSMAAQELYTVSKDRSIRVWSLPAVMQLMEFESGERERKNEEPCRVASHPSAHFLAVGFVSGSVRVLDLDSGSLVTEGRQHFSPIVALEFLPDPDSDAPRPPCFLLALCATGALSLYHEETGFQLTRSAENPGLPAVVVERDSTTAGGAGGCLKGSPLVTSPNGLLLARFAGAKSVAIVGFPSLRLLERIRIGGPTSAVVTSFAFSEDNSAVAVASSDSRLRVYPLGVVALGVEGEGLGGAEKGGLRGTAGGLRCAYSVPLLSGAVGGLWLSSYSSVPFPESAGLGAERLRLHGFGREAAEREEINKARARQVQVAITGGADKQIKVWDLTDSAAKGTGVHKGGGSLLSGLSMSTFESPPPFQCFVGHSALPFKILTTGSHVVSVSEGEVFVWRFQGPFLQALNDARVPAFVTGGTAGMEVEEVHPSVHATKTGGLRTERVVQEEVSASEVVESRAVAAVAEKGGEAWSAMTERGDQVMDAGGLPSVSGGSPSPPGLVSSRDLTGGQLRGEIEGLLREGDEEEMRGEAVVEEGRGGRTLPLLRQEESIKFRPLHVCGSSASTCATPFVWRPQLGLILHSVGNCVHVENLRDPLTEEESGKIGLRAQQGEGEGDGDGVSLGSSSKRRYSLLASDVHEALRGAVRALALSEDGTVAATVHRLESQSGQAGVRTLLALWGVEKCVVSCLSELSEEYNEGLPRLLFVGGGPSENPRVRLPTYVVTSCVSSTEGEVGVLRQDVFCCSEGLVRARGAEGKFRPISWVSSLCTSSCTLGSTLVASEGGAHVGCHDEWVTLGEGVCLFWQVLRLRREAKSLFQGGKESKGRVVSSRQKQTGASDQVAAEGEDQFVVELQHQQMQSFPEYLVSSSSSSSSASASAHETATTEKEKDLRAGRGHISAGKPPLFTCAGLTRAGKWGPALLFVGTNQGSVICVDFDRNRLLFEALLQHSPIDAIGLSLDGASLVAAFSPAASVCRFRVDALVKQAVARGTQSKGSQGAASHVFKRHDLTKKENWWKRSERGVSEGDRPAAVEGEGETAIMEEGGASSSALSFVPSERGRAPPQRGGGSSSAPAGGAPPAAEGRDLSLPYLPVDGRVVCLQFDGGAEEGLVATGSNSVWYLNLVEKVSVRLHGAHTGPPSVVASSSSISPPWVRGEGGQQQRQVLLASAAADLSVRVWSVSLCVSPSQVADDVARPQHVALFAVPYRCSDLCFLALPCPSGRMLSDGKGETETSPLLLGTFTDGAVRLFDSEQMKAVAKIGLGDEGDAPFRVATVEAGLAVVGTRRGFVVLLEVFREEDDEEADGEGVAGEVERGEGSPVGAATVPPAPLSVGARMSVEDRGSGGSVCSVAVARGVPRGGGGGAVVAVAWTSGVVRVYKVEERGATEG
eukprot:Cvel_23925.t1-p1 / transcript=Cvel_23925.t1 / gene=Cvel_23925 / organism=Chromera_velia_CCMP2878 / gene_product=WD repeat-containing protein 90, putative / transcript_product=WD repeat-containing protein 90, putative / location=Cvel_scaffold2525:12366-27586(+) / protein_length=2254 / sequence_SO=supercontig / SO=protein_coding / is_pseudo=false